MRVLTFLLALLVLGLSAQADAAANQTIEEPRIRSGSTRLFSSGGGNAAFTRGVEALLVNPAAYTGAGELALIAAGASLYASPDQVLRAPVAVLTGDALPLFGSASRVFADRITREGIGFGGMAGLGYAGNSLGLGIISEFDAFLREENGVVEGQFVAEAGLTGGLALGFDLGPFAVSVGADIRPFIRMRADISDPDQVDAFLAGQPFFEAFADAPTLNGFGLGLNAGFTAAYRAFTLGFVVRDLGGTQIVYREHPLGEVITSALSGVLPPGGAGAGELYDPDANYVLPSQTRVGLAWVPDLGPIFAPVAYLELVDLHRVGRSDTDPADVFSAGGQLTLGQFLTLRGGVNAHGFGAGAGIRFGVLNLDGGISFGRSSAPQAGLDLSIRF